MKILIVNTLESRGGAARAAYRLHKSLLALHIDSQMLVQNKVSDDFTVITSKSKIRRKFNEFRVIIDSIPTRFYRDREKTLFSPSWFRCNDIIDIINKINPDIVHLHWITFGMITIEDIARINAPIVWSLHDNWAFTGGCHIKWECEKYRDSCGACPILKSTKEFDLSRRVWHRKKKSFTKIKNITIVGLSRWLMECSKESTLLGDKKHVNIPNPIDTDIFKPFNKIKSRELWSLPQKTKLILFGAINATNDINKGFKELSRALMKCESNDIEFVVFGSSRPKNPYNFGFKTHYLGHLYDDVSLVTLYNAVDIMVVPSLQENLSNAIMESLSCATPVVAFDTGGNSDLVEHLCNGYLAKSFDSNDLGYGISWVLNNKNYDIICKNSRDKIVQEFDSKVVAKRYIELYRDILTH